MVDLSFKPDPASKGSYYRRIEDIERALDELTAAQLPDAPKFLAYFFGCEKLAQAIVGIHSGRAALDQYKSSKPLNLTLIKTAAAALNLKIAMNDLDYLFADHKQLSLIGGVPSARVLRNTLTHDFGPSNVKMLVGHSAALLPKMVDFLGCAEDVLKYLRSNYAHVK